MVLPPSGLSKANLRSSEVRDHGGEMDKGTRKEDPNLPDLGLQALLKVNPLPRAARCSGSALN